MSATNLPRFGRARVQPLASGAYRPSDDGKWAVVLEVRDRHNELADLVAWLPDDPGHWWPRHGDETPLLGARSLAFAADCHEPVTLLPTPEAWLFAHRERPKLDARMTGAEVYVGPGAVVCIMDWGVDFAPLFDGVLRVDCDSPDLRERFQRALRAWEPKITVAHQEGRHAA